VAFFIARGRYDLPKMRGKRRQLLRGLSWGCTLLFLWCCVLCFDEMNTRDGRPPAFFNFSLRSWRIRYTTYSDAPGSEADISFMGISYRAKWEVTSSFATRVRVADPMFRQFRVSIFYLLVPLVVHLMLTQAEKRRRHQRAQRRDAGLCVECGYDLRASTSHCPECGARPEKAPA